MKRLRIISLFCVICLLLTACKRNPASSSAGGETSVTPSGGFKDTEATFVSPEGLSVSEITPAQISAEEAKKLWCYNTLNETQQYYYKIMLTMVRNLTEGFVSLGYGGNNFSSDIAIAYRALMNDYPEYYWMPDSYFISASEGVYSVAFKRNSLENGYGFEIFEIEDNFIEFEDAIDLIITRASKGKTIYEKQKILHDELCKRVTYSEETDDHTVYSAYGALVNGRALCEGYARAFQLLCNRLGIENVLVSGTSKDVGHLWNMVKTEEGWSHVDVTWDDLKSDTLYTYLNLTKMQILIDHDIDSDYKDASPNLISQGHSFNFNLPEASTQKQDYFTRNNLIFDYDDTYSMAKAVVNRYNAGDFNAQFIFSSEEDAETFMAEYETLIVEVQKDINEILGDSIIKLQTISFSRDTCIFYFKKA